jgi:hypothetical protein
MEDRSYGMTLLKIAHETRGMTRRDQGRDTAVARSRGGKSGVTVLAARWGVDAATVPHDVVRDVGAIAAEVVDVDNTFANNGCVTISPLVEDVLHYNTLAH